MRPIGSLLCMCMCVCMYVCVCGCADKAVPGPSLTSPVAKSYLPTCTQEMTSARQPDPAYACAFSLNVCMGMRVHGYACVCVCVCVW
jgi:hypothetical protein